MIVYWSQLMMMMMMMMMTMMVVVRGATVGVPVFVLLERGRTTAACWPAGLVAGPLIISETLMRRHC